MRAEPVKKKQNKLVDSTETGCKTSPRGGCRRGHCKHFRKTMNGITVFIISLVDNERTTPYLSRDVSLAVLTPLPITLSPEE
jgi:hypothetical protein